MSHGKESRSFILEENNYKVEGVVVVVVEVQVQVQVMLVRVSK